MSFLIYMWTPRWQNENGEDQGINACLIADSLEQMRATQDYYIHERGFRITANAFQDPKISGLRKKERMTAYRAESFLTRDFIEVPAQNDFTFSVNVNAWSSFVEEAKNIEALRKGSLYRWDSGIYAPFDYYLPERVMLALKYTDLRPYSRRAAEGLNLKDATLAKMTREKPETFFSLDGLLAFLGRKKQR